MLPGLLQHYFPPHCCDYITHGQGLLSNWGTVPELLFEKKGLIPTIQQLLIPYRRSESSSNEYHVKSVTFALQVFVNWDDYLNF
jgi:hypothetical protein